MTYHKYSVRERQVIIHLRYTAKRPLKQIADILDAPVSSIHKIVENARRKYSWTLKKTDLRRLSHTAKITSKQAFQWVKPHLTAKYLYYTMGLTDNIEGDKPP